MWAGFTRLGQATKRVSWANSDCYTGSNPVDIRAIDPRWPTDRLAVLRDEHTGNAVFRSALRGLTLMLVTGLLRTRFAKRFRSSRR